MFTRIFKLLALGGVFFLLGLVVLRAIDKENSKPSGDPDIAQLEQFEREKDYTNLMKALFENTDPAYSDKVITWLRTRDDAGIAFYYYATARHLLNRDQPYQALLYYTAAGLMARIDAMRCTDKTAGKLILHIERSFGDVRSYVKSQKGGLESASLWALSRENNVRFRPKPEWLCSFGEEEINQYLRYTPESEWKVARQEIRKKFETMMREGFKEEATDSGAGKG